jgi:hypothetical protein
MDPLLFGPITQEAADTLGFEDYDFSGIHEYSDLDLSRFEISGDLDWRVSRTMGVLLGFLYSDYEDADPYLADTSGTIGWVWAGVSFRF